jgi:hypothetical protein
MADYDREYDVHPDDIFFDAEDESTTMPSIRRERRIILSDDEVRRLVPRQTEYTIFDTLEPGFCVRIRPTGYASYYYVARAREPGEKAIKQHIARVGVITCDEARQRAALCARRREVGVSAPRNDRLLVASLLEAYTRYSAQRRGDAGWARNQSLVTRYVTAKLGADRISAISRFEYLECIDAAALAGRTCANNLQKTLKAFLFWCVRENYIDANPLARLPMPALSRRDQTWLRASTLANIYAASRQMDWPWSGMVGAIVLGGLNVETARYLHNKHIDWSNGLFCPRGCDPQRTHHWEPLSQQALRVLAPGRANSGFLFPSPRGESSPIHPRSSILDELHARVGYSGWSWIDLVRSTKGALESFKANCPSSGPGDDDHATWCDERRALLEAWALELLRLQDVSLADAARKDRELRDLVL